MAIQRVVKKLQIAPDRVKYRVVVTGEPCTPHTHEARQHQGFFLCWLAENQSLLDCGYGIFDRLTITHNGYCWEAVVEAEVEEKELA